MTLDQWRKFRQVIIRALLAIVRHLQEQEQAEKHTPRSFETKREQGRRGEE